MLTISKRRPPGHINRWPPGDAVAWQMLVTHAEKMIALEGVNEAVAYSDSALVLNLEGGERNWLVDNALAQVHGIFYLAGWDHHQKAKA